MKNLKPLILSAIITFASVGMANAANLNKGGDKDKVKIDSAEFKKLTPEMQKTALDLKDRLNEAFAIDKSELNKEEKSALKSEIKSLKTELKDFQKRAVGNGGIYISTGGLIIIILLLILIF